jgi:drug/metabolite transporter (DMT)-like permease
MNTTSATAIGLGAVALWAILAALTALAGAVPPFQLAAMTFTIGTAVGLLWARLTGQSLAALRHVPLGAWALSVYGLLGFHVCYFFALQAAPVLEASLVIYLWPLLIVLFTGLLPARAGGGPLRWWHLAGAVLGFLGSLAILLGGAGRASFSGAGAGLAMAFAAALIWSSYSVGTRLFAAVPSIAVIGACAATAIGSAVLHLALETTRLPAGLVAWLAVLGLGLGPVGLAFYLWDEGMKRGDIRLLGVAPYATPLGSTIILAATGLGTATGALWLAAGLITAGALLASLESWWPRSP